MKDMLLTATKMILTLHRVNVSITTTKNPNQKTCVCDFIYIPYKYNAPLRPPKKADGYPWEDEWL